MRGRIERARRQDESLVLVEVLNDIEVFGKGNSVIAHGMRFEHVPIRCLVWALEEHARMQHDGHEEPRLALE